MALATSWDDFVNPFSLGTRPCQLQSNRSGDTILSIIYDATTPFKTGPQGEVFEDGAHALNRRRRNAPFRQAHARSEPSRLCGGYNLASAPPLAEQEEWGDRRVVRQRPLQGASGAHHDGTD
jgi:hypothetical protein